MCIEKIMILTLKNGLTPGCKVHWGAQHWCFVSVVCCFILSVDRHWALARGAALGGTCSFCKARQRLLFSIAFVCSSLAILGCCGWAVWAPPMEGGCFPPAINNTSVQPRLQGQEAAQHKGNGLGCRLERYKRTEKMMNVFQSCLNYGCAHKPVFDCSPFKNGRPFSFLMSNILMLPLYMYGYTQIHTKICINTQT